MQNLYLVSSEDLLSLVRSLSSSDSPYLTVKESALYLRESESSFRSRIHGKELLEGVHYFKKSGCTILFLKTALDLWLLNGGSSSGKSIQQKGDSLSSALQKWHKETGLTPCT